MATRASKIEDEPKLNSQIIPVHLSPRVIYLFTCKMSRILSRLSAPLARNETLIIRRCSASLFILSGVICSAVTENMEGTEARVVCIAVDGSEHSEKAFDCK